MNHLGRYLKKRLNELKASEREISAKCGISHSYLNQLIKGINPSTKKKISPTLSTFEKLSQGFDVSVESLQKISRGIKDSDIDNKEYQLQSLLTQIHDFYDFIMELGLERKKYTENEWEALISRLEKLCSCEYLKKLKSFKRV